MLRSDQRFACGKYTATANVMLCHTQAFSCKIPGGVYEAKHWKRTTFGDTNNFFLDFKPSHGYKG